MVRLAKWSVLPMMGTDAAPFQVRNLRLVGLAFGHPKFADGECLITSAIVHVGGCFIRTESGNTYRLVGDPDPDYLDWLESLGCLFNPKQPLQLDMA